MLMMFMDQAKERGESVLICADGSLSQCITVAVIYLMIKYICQRDRFKWALLKTIQFVGRKFKQMSIRGGYFSLL